MAAILQGGCAPKKELREPVPQAPVKRDTSIDPALRERATRMITDLRNLADPLARANSIEAMKTVYTPAFEPAILSGFDDPSPIVRKCAALASGELKIAKAREGLLRCAEDADRQVAIAGSFGLLSLGDDSQWVAMDNFSRDSEAGVRGDLALVLGLLKNKRAIDILQRLKHDRDPGVGLQAIEALCRCGDKTAGEELIGMTISKYPNEQILAMLALPAVPDPRVITHLRGGLSDDYDEVRLAAARGLGLLGSDEGMGVAIRGIRDTDPRRREMGAMALGSIGRADAQGYLRSLLDDRISTVRLAAAMAILQLK